MSGLWPAQTLLHAAPQTELPQRILETASLAQNNKSFDFAIKEWDKLLARHPDSEYIPLANYNAGVCSLELGQFEKAIGYFQTASPILDPESGLRPKANLFLGFAQYRHGKELNQTQAQQQRATGGLLIPSLKRSTKPVFFKAELTKSLVATKMPLLRTLRC